MYDDNNEEYLGLRRRDNGFVQPQNEWPTEDGEGPPPPVSPMTPGYGYQQGYQAPTAAGAYLQGRHAQAPQITAPRPTTIPNSQTYPLFKETPCKPSPPSNGDVKESEYEKFINWFLNAHLGKTWVLVDFILTDGSKIQGSVMNIINLSYTSNPKPSQMGVEVAIVGRLYKGFICIPLSNIQMEKATVSDSQYKW